MYKSLLYDGIRSKLMGWMKNKGGLLLLYYII